MAVAAEDLATQVRVLKKELKEWEHAFEDEVGRKPTKEDIVAASDGDVHDRDSLGAHRKHAPFASFLADLAPVNRIQCTNSSSMPN